MTILPTAFPGSLLLPAHYEDGLGLLGEQYLVRTFLRKPIALEREQDRTYIDEARLWVDVLSERLHAELCLHLDGFRIFEWLPRSPGLYHTNQAEVARRDALQNMDQVLSEGGRQIVYNSSGKLSMLRGGIGAIRLKPVTFPPPLGQYWFMCASSSLGPDGGFPLAIPNHYYNALKDQIQEKGFAIGQITGTIKFLPNDDVPLYSFSQGISHLYLLVDQIQTGVGSRAVEADTHVAVAASFISSFEGNPGLYGTFVTFNPAKANDKADAVTWMNDVYVEGRYRGKIVTDFDQQAPRFGNALFSLDQILGSDNPGEILTKVANAFDEYGESNGQSELKWMAAEIRQRRPSGVYNIYAKSMTMISKSPGAIAVSGSDNVQAATDEARVTADIKTGKTAMSDDRLQMLLAFVFGIVFLGTILMLVTFIPTPTSQQFETFPIVMALAAGGVAAVIPGFLHLNLSRGQDLALRAGGAVAVFVIVYFYSPAQWATP